MEFCDTHWNGLRDLIEEAGLRDLIPEEGVTAGEMFADAVNTGRDTPVNFDPLGFAHWSIVSKTLETLERAGGNGMYLLSDGPEDPVAGHPGRTWPKCPVCYLNVAHEISCRDTRCTLDKQRGYDFFLVKAAATALERAKELGLKT